jgi:hypothetical protein
MRTPLALLVVIFFIGCNKSSKTDKELKTVPMAVINPYWDSLYVTATNHTHPQLSLPKTGLPGKIKSGFEPSLTIQAVENDTITFQNILKRGNTLGRHPLFLKEWAYTTGRRGAYRGTLFFNEVPQGQIIQIKTKNTSDKYVTAMLVYNGMEDSLFALEPQSATTEFETVGYFKVVDTASIKRPFIKFYFGQTPPFATTMSSLPIWGDGAVNIASSTEPYSQGNVFFVPVKQ